MTKIEIELPDELVQRARDTGLLTDGAIQALLEDAMRRRAGRALMDLARDIQKAGIPPMSMEEINAEVKAVRAERRSFGRLLMEAPIDDGDLPIRAQGWLSVGPFAK